jgi:hypothetical protein
MNGGDEWPTKRWRSVSQAQGDGFSRMQRRATGGTISRRPASFAARLLRNQAASPRAGSAAKSMLARSAVDDSG